MSSSLRRTDRSPAGPLPSVLTPVTALAAWFYAAGVNARNRRFDTDAARAKRVPIPVISIGNITVGGTGKTPFASFLADLLTASGHRPVIAMRGYKARDGALSDEQDEHQRRLPGVDVVADPDRHAALTQYLRAHSECDCVLLDDGFQHRQLARDLDLVLVDATHVRPDTDRLLPAGWLREPAANLRRADGVILTRADLKDETRLDELRAAIVDLHGRSPLAEFSHSWSHLTSADGQQLPTTWLANKRIVVTCAVGNPGSVLDMAGQCGAMIPATHIIKDHAQYDRNDLKTLLRLSASADAILTTEKDWSKLGPLLQRESLNTPIVRPFLTMAPIAGLDALKDSVLQCVKRGRE